MEPTRRFIRNGSNESRPGNQHEHPGIINPYRFADDYLFAAASTVSASVFAGYLTIWFIATLLADTSFETGTDLLYIQSLLWNSSSKTTEIYILITTKGFNQINNSTDNLGNFIGKICN